MLLKHKSNIYVNQMKSKASQMWSCSVSTYQQFFKLQLFFLNELGNLCFVPLWYKQVEDAAWSSIKKVHKSFSFLHEEKAGKSKNLLKSESHHIYSLQ